MRLLLIAPYYITWHYSRAIKGIVVIAQNSLWFLWHFFSIPLLTTTLFTPWQRIQEVHSRGLDIEAYLSTAIVNGVMRFVGAIIRLLFICIGLIALSITLVVSIVVLIIWLALPLLIAFLLIYGFILLFRTP